ncbi:hypothetical protein A9995_14545 [Erythrobacter sp. QSSC1-22B]|uniref:WD40 repeat domain-containing protein n=1 Tax=Erythrobacter sp. QSSC1-22B TaxID=1860125 RepID=UPI000804E8D1|nr:WD40 repeat domain-containing protein [Erythrobacter sp. QSSC1-22B]OBX17876.1 hypothetical protein A9995_14545 [Erythrobacter sp. QSSC1-22B]
MIALEQDPLVERQGRRFDLDASVTSIHWVDDTAWLACGDGIVRRISVEGDYKPLAAHQGAILSAAADPDGGALLTGGDDGRVLRLARDGSAEEVGHFGRYWIEHLVASPKSGIIVAGVGKEAVVWLRGQRDAAHRFQFASTIGGLALDGKGKRLAATHYGGASLLFAASASSGNIALKWAGSHLGCTLSADGSYLVSAMQETGLHGWKLPQKTDIAMRGYKAKTRSFSWSHRNKWLATGGDSSAILWPFEGKTGPVGKRPLLLGASESLVTKVAFHPRLDFLAAGYADGSVALLSTADDISINVEKPVSRAISALSWRADGAMLAWGSEQGSAGLLEVDPVTRMALAPYRQQPG